MSPFVNVYRPAVCWLGMVFNWRLCAIDAENESMKQNTMLEF